MATQDFKRKLTTILHADVKGYSRLMGEDEEATVSTLTAYRDVMSVLIQKHRGRVVHGLGDSLLAEFISVLDAVQCAVEIQKELKTRNAELSEDRKVKFRIGINPGDVIEKDDDLHGDGVNIAARVETLKLNDTILETLGIPKNLLPPYRTFHRHEHVGRDAQGWTSGRGNTCLRRAGRSTGSTGRPNLFFSR